MTNDVTGSGKSRKRKYVDLVTKIDLWITWMTVKEVKIKGSPFLLDQGDFKSIVYRVIRIGKRYVFGVVMT